MPDTQDLVKQYFIEKSRQLAALADMSICQHSGLIGSHREQIYRLYLQEILPKKYAVGRGMIYGKSHKSKETDIVIWDSLNYPNLPMSDHSFFFVESVKAVIECKSKWSNKEFDNVTDKCKSIKSVVPQKSISVKDEIYRLNLEIDCLKNNKPFLEPLAPAYHIGTTAIFMQGGNNLANKKELKRFLEEKINLKGKFFIFDDFPDVMLLLKTGIVSIKYYPKEYGLFTYGCLKFFKLRENSLLIFTEHLLKLLDERSINNEGDFYFSDYLNVPLEPYFEISFDVGRNDGLYSV
jgi:hypothetical protein